jgi:ABC-type maltose transport system permease subunit
MRFRKLRIVWSIGCGIICLLLIVLWVRSYWLEDIFIAQQSSQSYAGIDSSNARIIVGTTSEVGLPLWAWVVEPNRHPVKYVPWFEVSYRTNSCEIYTPTWLLVILTASVAAVPWKRWRFTLRTLLIATTLIAVVLGLIVAVV